MEKLFNEISIFFGLIAGVLIAFLGGLDELITCLLSFIVIDYMTGVLKAIYNKEINSTIGFKGIIRKVTIILVVGMSVMLQNYVGIPSIREIVICFFIANEGISILENIGKMGIPLPERLKEILAQLRTKGDDKNE